MTITVDPARLAEITHLAEGAHGTPDGTPDQVCMLEAVAYVAGLPHSDRPSCTSPVLGEFGRRLNDALSDDMRQELIPLIPRLVGTAGDGLDERRSYLALDWLIRVYTPAWLELAGLTEEAAALRDLGRIVDLVSAERAGPVVRAGQKKAAAAGAAAGAAAWAAARAAAGEAAGAAAWAAARAAAGEAAGAAAWAAAGEAAGAAAWEAAGAAAGAAAWAAAWAAAGEAAGAATWEAAGAATWEAARAAAREAAGEALAPTVEQLQRSAIALLDSMIAPA